MGIILGILIAIVIIYKIYICFKNMIKLLLNPKFYIGAVVLFLYVMASIKVILFVDRMYNKLIPYSESFFLGLISIIFYLTIMGIIIYQLGKLYYKAALNCRSLMLPVYFLLTILSLGLVAFKIYNIGSEFMGSNDKEFVDPHWVKGYERKDGTFVNGYWRDGDGNTKINLDKEHGGGYFRSKS